MAALQKVENFDIIGLEEFKKSLLCICCLRSPRPPGPGSKIYRDVRLEQLKHDGFLCQSCFEDGDVIDQSDYKFDAILTHFVSLLKFYECNHVIFGCKDEFEAKDLEAHEKICQYRPVTCPKLDCHNEFIFCDILEEHFQVNHNENVKIKDDVLDYKGSLEDLEESVFVLNSYGRPSFPQFYDKGNMLHFWVVGHGNQDELCSFEVITNLKLVLV